MVSNGLVEVERIMESEAVVIRREALSQEKEMILENFLFRMQSVLAARDNKYILLNAPNDKLEEICSLLPGMKSPTVMPLSDPEWSSVHSVLNEKTFWTVIDKLKAAGAQGILVIPIEKMINKNILLWRICLKKSRRYLVKVERFSVINSKYVSRETSCGLSGFDTAASPPTQPPEVVPSGR